MGEGRVLRHMRRLATTAVLALLAGNLVALWITRGDRVSGWDLFGPTFGVLAIDKGGVSGAIRTVWAAFLSQRGRPVFTGGESFLYGLLPGLLNEVHPWLLWSHALSAALVLGTLWWAARPLRVERRALFACLLASPALVSQTIVGLPHLASVITTFVPAVVWVVVEAHRGRARPVIAAWALDAVVFAAIAFVAFGGYEAGKTVFVVPAVAAVTLRSVPTPRRLGWLAIAVGIGWLMHVTQPMTTTAAIAAVPRDLAGLIAGLARIPRRYFIDWHVDFPALTVAALVAVPLLRRDGAFWIAMLLVAAGLVSLSAYQFDGAFLSPHRFLLLFVIEALAIATALSAPPSVGTRIVWAVLVVGMGYTTWRTVDFVARPWDERPRDFNVDRVYPLPYNVSSFENQLWLDRIRDARAVVSLVRAGSEQHVFVYGFSVRGEDGVNPQLFISRLLLPLGRQTFDRRIAFFDHEPRMFFRWPVRPMAQLGAYLASRRTPFYIHVFEPDHEARAIVATMLNRSRVVEVDLGLTGFRSLRVEAYAPPGPVDPPRATPAVVARTQEAAAQGRPGLCVLRWHQGQEGHATLAHPGRTLAAQLRALAGRQWAHDDPWRYQAWHRDVEPAVDLTLDQSSVALAAGWLRVPPGATRDVTFVIESDDEVAVTLNDLPLVESRPYHPRQRWVVPVRLAPGAYELMAAYHKYWGPGRMRLTATSADGRPLEWRCAPDFGTVAAP